MSKFNPDEYLADQEERTEESFNPEAYAALEEPAQSAVLGADAGSSTESFVMGAAEGLLGKTAAGVNATVSSFMDGDYSLEQWSEKYKVFKDGMNEDIDRAKRNHPGVAMSGDITASLASLAIPGVGVASKSLAGTAALAGASGLTRSREEEIDQWLLDGVTGAMTGAAGYGLVAGAGKAITGLAYLKKRAVAATLPAISSKQIKEVDGLLKRIYSVDEISKKTGEGLLELGEDINRLGLLPKNTGMHGLHVNAQQLKDNAGTTLGKFIKEADTLLGNKGVQDPEQVRKILEIKLNPIINPKVVTKATTKAAKTVRDYLNTFNDIAPEAYKDLDGVIQRQVMGNFLPKKGEKWSISLFEDVRKALDVEVSALNKKVSKTASDRIELNGLSTMASYLREMSEESIDLALKDIDNPLLAAGYKAAKKDYAVISTISDLFSTAVNKPKGNEMWGRVRTSLANNIGTRVTSTLFGKTPPKAGEVAVKALNDVDTILLDNMGGSMRAGLSIAKDYASKNMTQANVQRFVRALHFEDATNEFLDDELAVFMAHSQLANNPLERSNDYLIKNANAIATLVRDEDEELASQFQKAIEEQNEGDIESLGAMISNLPQARKYFKPGIGFNGKVSSPEERAIVLKQLETDQSISYAQRLAHKKALLEDGIIPQPVPEPDRFMQYKSNKNEKPKM